MPGDRRLLARRAAVASGQVDVDADSDVLQQVTG
jgi:hypothetical protein